MYKIPGAGRQDGLEVDVELVEATLELVDIEGVVEGVINDPEEDPVEEDPVEDGPVEEDPVEEDPVEVEDKDVKVLVLKDRDEDGDEDAEALLLDEDEELLLLDVEDMLLLELEALKLGLVKEELLDETVLKVPEGVVAVV
ncbi:hypothetical protein BFW01_g6550 [Lasiodiplodia theobromae]|nr:hypothetical protein BFW01_g6550 [Lasiodiplodia theobromae]